MSVGNLVVRLGLDASEYFTSLKKSKAEAKEFADGVANAMEYAKTGLLAAGAAAVGAFAAMNAQAETIANFQDLSDKIGDTAENIASLKKASDISGVSLDTVASASVKLTSALAKTDDESKGVGLALQALNINLDDFKKLSPVEQIDKVAQAMGGFADGAEKTATATQLFGKSGADLIPILNDLAGDYGRQVTLTQEQIEATDKYTIKVGELKSEFSTLTQQITADAIPAMTRTVEIFESLTKSTAGTASDFNIFGGAVDIFNKTLEAFLVIGAEVVFAFKVLGIAIGGTLAQMEALRKLDFSGFKTISTSIAEDIIAARKEVAKFSSDLINGPLKFNASAGGGRGTGVDPRAGIIDPSTLVGFKPKIDTSRFTPAKAGGAGGAKSTEISDAEKYLEALRKQGQAARELNNEEKALEEIQAGRIKGITTAQQEQILETARQLDLWKQQKQVQDDLAKTQDEVAKSQREVDDAYTDFINNIIENSPEGIFRAQQEELIKYQEALANYDISEEQYASAVRKLYGIKDAVVEVDNTYQEMGDTIAQGFEDAIFEGKKFSDVLKQMAIDIAKIAFQKSVTQPLANAAGSFLGNLFGFEGGGYTGNSPRSGGVDGKGGFLSILHPQETVVDHAQGQKMGGGSVTVNVINSGQQVAVQGQNSRTDSNGNTQIDVMIGQVENRLADKISNGQGPLYGSMQGRFGLRTQAG